MPLVGRMRTEGGEGRDTEVCGDPKIWFPMRVTYQREMKVKAELDRLGIENFVPMRYRIAERRGGTNTNLTDDTNIRDNGDERTRMGRMKRIDGTTEVRRGTNTNLTNDTNIRDNGDERTRMGRMGRIYGTTEVRRGANTIATPHSQRENLTDDTNIQVGGTANHIHILFLLGKQVNVSEIVRTVKSSTSRWINEKTGNPFHRFYWQDGYGAFSVSSSHVDAVVAYIRGQEEHHKKVSFQDEFRRICELYKAGLDEKYAWD